MIKFFTPTVSPFSKEEPHCRKQFLTEMCSDKGRVWKRRAATGPERQISYLTEKETKIRRFSRFVKTLKSDQKAPSRPPK